MKSRDPPSRILLLIITHLPPQFPLTNDYLHEIFSSYGDIKKILIFERGKANKSFVEFHDIKCAISARKGMLGKDLAYCSGKIQIHFSKLRNLDLEVVDKSRGSEYQYSRTPQEQVYHQKPQPQQNTQGNKDQITTQIDQYYNLHSHDILDQLKENDQRFDEFTQEASFQPKLDNSEENIRKQMESLLDSDFQDEQKRNNNIPIPAWQLHNPTMIQYNQHKQEIPISQALKSRDPPSRILLLIITNLPPQFPLTNDYLHELFSPYGDIKKILIFERGKANKSFVEFHDIKCAISARKGMLGKDLAYCSGKIQIHFSKLRNLDLEVVDKSRGSEYQYSRTPQEQVYQQKPQSQQHTQANKNQVNNQPDRYYSLQSLDILDRLKEDDQRFDEFTQEAFQTIQDESDESIRKQMESLLDSDFQDEQKRSNTSQQTSIRSINNYNMDQQVIDNYPLFNSSQANWKQTNTPK